jgi:hypothetical protein
MLTYVDVWIHIFHVQAEAAALLGGISKIDFGALSVLSRAAPSLLHRVAHTLALLRKESVMSEERGAGHAIGGGGGLWGRRKATVLSEGVIAHLKSWVGVVREKVMHEEDRVDSHQSQQELQEREVLLEMRSCPAWSTLLSL